MPFAIDWRVIWKSSAGSTVHAIFKALNTCVHQVQCTLRDILCSVTMLCRAAGCSA
jgi:hypothetical protein